MLLRNTLADFVLHHPLPQQDQPALTFLDGSGEEKVTFTFQHLREACVGVAQNLRLESRKQTPVLLLLEDQADFVLGFLGCVLAGFIPAPLPPLRNQADRRSLGRALRILQEGRIRAVLVASKEAAWLKSQLLDAGLEQVSVWTIEALKQPVATEIQLPEISPSDTAYIQFTSGSTAAPKGVLLKHQHLVAQMEMMRRVFRRKALPRMAGWIPFHHDMGLVGHLFTVLYESGSGVFFPAPAFLANPKLWLDVMHRYRATAAAAPTFAFEQCTRRVALDPAWDFSCWEQAYVGSETVSYSVLQAFCQKFKPAGFQESTFRPVYGLAEATLLAAGGSRGLDELVADLRIKQVGEHTTRQLIPYTLEEGCTIRILDPATGQPAAAGEAGEVWVQGPGVPAAYFGLPTAEPTLGGVRTGDLGMIIDNQLFLTGRQKEITVIRGINYSAEDLEEIVRAHSPAVRGHDRTACVAHIAEEREYLWVFQEVQRHLPTDALQELFSTIQGGLADEFGIVADKVIFLPQGLMPKTANYKVARGQCEELFLTGQLKPLAVFPLPAAPASPVAAAPDRVVIVGAACRLPGGADSLEAFWELLAAGGDAISEVPAERWDNDLFFDERPAVPGKVSTKWAGFLDNIADFDPALFGISTFEAPEIDPQQRLLLETSWRLLEHTGWKKEALAGSATGVYVGISTNDYLYMKIKLMPGMDSFNAYSGLGNANSVAANRLSYFYDLKGPSMAVDTACSSSLTAFHLGTKAILNGECRQAMVGGVNAILSPGPTIILSQFGMMSPEGRCKTFDADANGYVRSEGCGLVMLKLESAALADGDRILAIVESSALGQDGASTGLTFPNGAAQRQLLRNGLAAARLTGHDISYVEAHGTGTRAGDPVEMEQIRHAFGAPSEQPCYVGSVKANVGHLEASAGIVSVIKTVLMLNKQQVPPQIHLQQLNPQINLAHSRLRIATALTEWKNSHRVRRAAISSFGFGGALANVILREPVPAPAAPVRQGQARAGLARLPFVVSGHSPEALKAQVEHLRDWLATEPQLPWSDCCFTYTTGRSDLRYKTYFLASSLRHLHEKLTSWLHLAPASPPELPAGVCYLFTGQGEHFLHMGKELYYAYPAFQHAFDRCAAALDTLGQPSCRELAFARADTAHWTDEIMQPIHFAIQYSLGILWMECGIEPQVLLGHSLGEYAAACLAGCFEPEDGMKMLRRRGELVRSLPEKGSMATLFLPCEEVQALLDPTSASIAAINSPAKTVVSGQFVEVSRLLKLCEARGVEAYQLKTEQAFHSALMDPILTQFHEYLTTIPFRAPKKKWISTLRGALVTTAPNADYWVEHLRNPVQFAQAVEQLRPEGALHFIEVGPGASTLAALRECTGGNDSLLLRSLTFKKGDRTESFYFLDSVGKLYVAGLPINWEVILPGQFRPELVPGQAFMSRPYWLQGLDPSKFAAGAPAAPVRQVSPVTASPLHYRLTWAAAGALPALPPVGAATQLTHWIVVGEAGPFVQAVLAVLKENKYPAFWIGTTPNSDRNLKPTIQLPAGAGPVEWGAALSKVKERKSRADAADWKIIFLDPLQAGAVFREDNPGLAHLIPLVQAIRSTALLATLWVVTHDAQAVGVGAAPNLNGAVTWGFGKTLFLEHPELRGGLLDLSLAEDAVTRATALVRKVATPQFEAAVGVRAGTQFIQQLSTAPPQAASPVVFRSDGAFIITGGLGGLGLKCAEWIRARGGKHLVLLSRQALPERSQWLALEPDHAQYATVQGLVRLEAQGAQVEPIALDVRDPVALGRLFERLDQQGVPVRGVMHAAGVNWFSKILTLDSQRFFETLKTKVLASWELHRHTLGRDLDCFVLFSSVSAVWGSVELSHYTAANQFMDALSTHRGQVGLPSLSLDWGPWAEVGMSARPTEKELLEKLGFALMPPGQALAALDAALAAPDHVQLIADVDWTRFQPFIDFSLQPSLFTNVVSTPLAKTNRASQQIQTRIQQSSPAEARQLVEEIVRAELRTVTLIESTSAIDAEQRFNFMGMDSLMAISYVVTLEKYFQLKLPAALTYNYPTIRALSDHLFQLLYKPEAVPADAASLQLLPAVASQPAAPGESWLVTLQPATSAEAPRLYCFPFAGSGVSVFGTWGHLLRPDVELIGIQGPGREERYDERPFTRINDFVAALLAVFPEQSSPYYLFGHSLGALLAYEFTLALQASGRQLPAGLVLSGCNAPLRPSAGKIHLLAGDEFVEEILSRFETPRSSEERRPALRENHATLKADIEMLETYEPAQQGLPIPLTVICGRQDPLTSPMRMKEWIQLAEADFTLAFVEGSHNLVTDNRADLTDLLSGMIGNRSQFDFQLV